MEALCANLLIGLLFSGVLRPSLAYPPKHYPQHALVQGPRIPESSQHAEHEQQKSAAEQQHQVNTVRVTCHPDSLEIIIKADMFGVGAPVNGDELRLGVEHEDFCRAAASSEDEYKILVGLLDCGTKYWMTEDSLVYTNLLIYAPVASPDGVIRMDEAVVPIECHYQRKYSLSSSSLTPTWIPFMSTQAAVETLDFDLKIMTDDWLYKRTSNVFYLGETINIKASVRVGHHMGLRVFLSTCVATLQPDIHSVPRYVFVENGCLVDSQLPGSKSHFSTRLQDDELHLAVDAFRFHEEDRGDLYITCHLNAVPVNDAEAPNKACTFVNGRWRSADGNDYLCGYCPEQNEAGQTHLKPSSPAKFSPRGFALKTNKVWEHQASVGPLMILPTMQRSGPLPVEELPPLLSKISRPALYGSWWRSGINDRVAPEKALPHQSTPEQKVVQTVASQNKDLKSEPDRKAEGAESDIAEALETATPGVALTKTAELDKNSTAALADISPTAHLPEVVVLSNVTAAD